MFTTFLLPFPIVPQDSPRMFPHHRGLWCDYSKGCQSSRSHSSTPPHPRVLARPWEVWPWEVSSCKYNLCFSLISIPQFLAKLHAGSLLKRRLSVPSSLTCPLAGVLVTVLACALPSWKQRWLSSTFWGSTSLSRPQILRWGDVCKTCSGSNMPPSEIRLLPL